MLFTIDANDDVVVVVRKRLGVVYRRDSCLHKTIMLFTVDDDIVVYRRRSCRCCLRLDNDVVYRRQSLLFTLGQCCYCLQKTITSVVYTRTMLLLFTEDDHVVVVYAWTTTLLFTEDDRRLQAKGRGAVRPPEPEVVQVDARRVLPVLLRSRLPRPQPGLPVGGGRQPRRPQTPAQRCAQDKGGSRRPARP